MKPYLDYPGIGITGGGKFEYLDPPLRIGIVYDLHGKVMEGITLGERTTRVWRPKIGPKST